MPTNRPTALDGFVRGTPKRKTNLARRSISLLGIAALLVMICVPLFGSNGVAEWFRLRRTEKALQQEVQRLEADNAVLDQQLEALSSDDEVLEKLAREKYNMRRPDEKVVLILD